MHRVIRNNGSVLGSITLLQPDYTFFHSPGVTLIFG